MQASGSSGIAYLSDFRELKVARWCGFDHLTPLSQALAALAACCVEIAPEEMGIENASGRIAAGPIHAPIAIPPYPIALARGRLWRRKIRWAFRPTRQGTHIRRCAEFLAAVHCRTMPMP